MTIEIRYSAWKSFQHLLCVFQICLKAKLLCVKKFFIFVIFFRFYFFFTFALSLIFALPLGSLWCDAVFHVYFLVVSVFQLFANNLIHTDIIVLFFAPLCLELVLITFCGE